MLGVMNCFARHQRGGEEEWLNNEYKIYKFAFLTS